jgi:hypothetical protein
MKLVSHPPDSADLGPCGFYLFGYLKRCLAGLSFEDANQLLAAGEDALEDAEKVTLKAVFLEWMDRLRKYIATKWGYPE